MNPPEPPTFDIHDPRLAWLLDRLPMAIAAVDRQGSIVALNRAATRLSGYTLADIPTMEAWRQRAFPDPAYRDRIARSWDAAVAQSDIDDEHITPRDLQIVLKNGETRTGTVFGIPVGGGYLALLIDQTNRQHYAAQIREAQKLRAVGTLAGGIAHEFNNLLAVMLMHLNVARSTADAPPSWREQLQEIESVMQRARELVSELLQFAAQQPRPHTRLDLRDIAEDAMRLVRPLAPASVRIRRCGAESTKVLGDKTQLTQLLLNLLINAIDAMRERPGIIEVTIIEGREATAPPDLPANLPAGRYHCLMVTDQGHGMRPEVLEQVFEPFFTTKPVGLGTGLGLAVVRGIAEAHHGAVRANSIPDHGTTLEVLLPVASH